MSELHALGGWLGSNLMGLMTLLFSAVVAWSAFMSLQLNRRLVDAELDPYITINLESRPYQVHIADIVIRNGGRGAARNLRFTLSFAAPPKKDSPNHDLLRWEVLNRGLPLLGPGQELRSAYGTFADIDVQHSSVTIVVDYERIHDENVRPKSFQSTFILDVRQLTGTQQIGAMIEEAKLRELQRIAADIHSVTRGNSSALKIARPRRS